VSTQYSFLPEMDYNPPNGNKTLIEYGPAQERSHYRAHVGAKTRRLYIFPTIEAANLQKTGVYKLRSVTMGPHVTATGHPIPISHFANINEALIPDNIYRRYEILNTDNTSLKGQKATAIVLEMLKTGTAPLPLNGQEVNDQTLQVEGCDIIIDASLRVQVKCDWLAGPKNLGGTGNLFIQYQEANVYEMY